MRKLLMQEKDEGELWKKKTNRLQGAYVVGHPTTSNLSALSTDQKTVLTYCSSCHEESTKSLVIFQITLAFLQLGERVPAWIKSKIREATLGGPSASRQHPHSLKLALSKMLCKHSAFHS